MQLGVVCGRSARHFVEQVVRTRSAMPTYGLGTRGPSPPLPGVTRAGDDPAADSPPSSPTEPTAASVHADGFFDVREAETPTKGRLPFSSPDPLEAWELVYQDGRAVPALAGDPVLDPLLDFLARCPPVSERGVSPHPCPRCTVELEPRPRQRADAGSRRRGRPASRSTRLPGGQLDEVRLLLLRCPHPRWLGAARDEDGGGGGAGCAYGRGGASRPFRGLCSKPLETLAVMHVLGRSINIQRLR